MNATRNAAMLCGFLIAAACFNAGAQSDVANHHVVNGMDVYLGVMPADAVGSLPSQEPAEKAMHGGKAGSDGYYHLNLSLYDSASHALVRDAEVRAAVEELGSGTETRKLEPMTINGFVSYGNYFRMVASHAYSIDVQIARPGRPAAHTTFQYRVY